VDFEEFLLASRSSVEEAVLLGVFFWKIAFFRMGKGAG